ncbi:hypothetical protein SCL_1158 [Sulfuricaulis limicola]|uniref:Uncharacterized protein n=1 Tax=Sulfuricaulis limicola TaxID=1620215 RepID=A0A1B4XF93_9GAMM|nr:hypothetical protein SCL_1158 [Sulfuricaulis limicola]
MAKATPCGRTTTAPVRPAMKSALTVARVTIGHQRRNGKILVQKVLQYGVVVTVCCMKGPVEAD